MRDGRLTPRTLLSPGETVSVEAVVRRPSWLGWALGSTRHVHRHDPRTCRRRERALAYGGSRVAGEGELRPSGERGRLRTSAAGPSAPHGARLRSGVGLPRARSRSRPRRARGSGSAARSRSAGFRPPTCRLRSAARRRARGSPRRLRSGSPSPSRSPTCSAATPAALAAHAGRWRQPDSHTLVFVPSGLRRPLRRRAARRRFRDTVAVAARSGGRPGDDPREIDWTVPPGSTLRLQQLLAQAGYLPLDWTPAARRSRARRAPSCRPPSTPPEGASAGATRTRRPSCARSGARASRTQITRGAVMMFQDEHGLDRRRHRRRRTCGTRCSPTRSPASAAARGYSYVYVHRNVPAVADALAQRPHRPHLARQHRRARRADRSSARSRCSSTSRSTTMSGTNPDGSHYNDPGIKWVSYFNGGDALHAFTARVLRHAAEPRLRRAAARRRRRRSGPTRRSARSSRSRSERR